MKWRVVKQGGCRLKRKPLPFIPYHPRLAGAFFSPKLSEFEYADQFRESWFEQHETDRGVEQAARMVDLLPDRKEITESARLIRGAIKATVFWHSLQRAFDELDDEPAHCQAEMAAEGEPEVVWTSEDPAP